MGANVAMDRYEDKERITVLEVHVGELRSDLSEHRNIEELYMREHTQILNEIRQEQAKMKGFVGGVVFVCSAVFAALGIAINKLFGS